jgi:hypothetical protein
VARRLEEQDHVDAAVRARQRIGTGSLESNPIADAVSHRARTRSLELRGVGGDAEDPCPGARRDVARRPADAAAHVEDLAARIDRGIGRQP